MKVSFELSMPNVGSWNGKWSGANNLYAKIVDFGKGKANEAKAQEILSAKSYYYNFGDGWGASVAVRAVDGKEAARTIERHLLGMFWCIPSKENEPMIYRDQAIEWLRGYFKLEGLIKLAIIICVI